MDIILYGAGRLGEHVLQVTKKYKDICVLGFADSFKNGTHAGLPILEICNQVEAYKDIPVVIAVGGFVVPRKEIYWKLRKAGFRHIYYYWNKTYCSGSDFLRDECVALGTASNNILFYAEMSIVDHCNLNCKGCNHYAAIFPKRFPDTDARIHDVKKIKELYDDVIEFGLIGGEPLLNPDAGTYIEQVRSMLPNTKIQMVTNGLLIPTVDEKILQCIKEHGVLVVISEYVPTSKMIGDIVARLKSYEIDYEIRAVDIKKNFCKTLSIRKDSIYPHKCISLGCTNICDGRIARCPTVLYIEKLNEIFRVDFPSEGIYRLEEYKDGRELDLDLERRIPLCDYCIDYMFKWEPCGAEVLLDDFVVRE